VAETPQAEASPVADLSYRDYDGPFKDAKYRFWVITMTGIRAAIKKKGFWIWSILSTWFYLILAVILYFVIENLRNQMAEVAESVITALSNTDWNSQILNGINFAQIPILLVTLLIGAGIIANDNRANALIMYLSKPITRLDYLLGKWLTIFLLVTVVIMVPAASFYSYGLLTLREFGFGTNPWMLPQIVLLSALIGSLYASLMVGISSLFKQARIAGAVMAGLYLLTNLFTIIIGQIRMSTTVDNEPIAIFNRLFYLSVDGLVHGMGKIVLNTDGEPPFGIAGEGEMRMLVVPAPEWWWFVPLFFGIQALFLWIAWTRIRAVEVVG
jgi:ABC-2 type transport system permease protein